MQLAIFDFDGTISNKDSMFDFIRFAVGQRSYYQGLLLLSPMLIAYVMGLLPNHIAKQKLLAYFFKGWDGNVFKQKASLYANQRLESIVRPGALQKIRWHQQKSHHVVVVTASMEYWLKPWCEKYNIDLIATKLEIKNNKLTGKWITKNCHGREKIKRLECQYQLIDYDYIYAYGDSLGDKPILNIANESYYKPFRK